MSKVSLYCVYDGLAQITVSSFEQPNDDCAKRAVKPLLRRDDLDFSSFSLIKLADFDREAPHIHGYREPEIVCLLSDLMEANHEPQ